MVRLHTAFVAAIVFSIVTVLACEIRVRDSAFRTARDVHKLCVIADAGDEKAAEIASSLNRWLETAGDDLNLEVVVVDADDPETNWQSLGLPSAPPVLPVTVLIGRDNGSGTSFIIDHWEPAPAPDQLDRIANSPARAELAKRLATNVAVLVYAPGSEDVELPGSAAAETLSSEEITAIVESGIEGERIGLSLIVLDRNDPDERLLCKFMGLGPGSPDTLCVAIGRGKLMSPPLVGDQITSANIDALVTQIRQACSCSQPLPTMGVDVPLQWTAAVDGTVVLMDDELDMSTLAEEVETMLAAKAAAPDEDAPATLVPIPGGAAPESAKGEADAEPKPDVEATVDKGHPASAINVRGKPIAIALLAIVVAVAVVGRLLHPRSPKT